jgi:hypothetical protein
MPKIIGFDEEARRGLIQQADAVNVNISTWSPPASSTR